MPLSSAARYATLKLLLLSLQRVFYFRWQGEALLQKRISEFQLSTVISATVGVADKYVSLLQMSGVLPLAWGTST